MDGWIYMDVTDFTYQLVHQMFKTNIDLPAETMCFKSWLSSPFAKKQPTFTGPTRVYA